MGKRKAAQVVGAGTGRAARGVRNADGTGQLVQQKTKALRTASVVSTSAVKTALEDPLRATWLPLGAQDGSSVLDRLRADLSAHGELCTQLRRSHARSIKLRGGRGGDAFDAPTESLVVGLNAVSAHMERGSLRLAVVAKDAWPSACLQHLPILAHATGTPICLLADAAAPLGHAVGATRLDAIGFCAGGEPWQDALVGFVRGKTPQVGAPPWFAFVPGLPAQPGGVAGAGRQAGDFPPPGRGWKSIGKQSSV